MCASSCGVVRAVAVQGSARGAIALLGELATGFEAALATDSEALMAWVRPADLEQRDRNKVMAEFRAGTTRVLIATDVVARGIDVQGVSLVINLDLPRERENYIHRIGRAGRYGRKGVAVSFVTQRDVPYVKDIEAHYHTTIEEMPVDVDAHLR